MNEGKHAEVRNANGKGKNGLLKTLLQFALTIVIAFAAVSLVVNFVIQPFEIPSGSMISTLEIGDRILAEKVSYRFESPKKGDIVTFKSVDGNGKTLIKRVIATAGQKVDLGYDGSVYVDDVKLDEPYAKGLSIPLSDSNVKYPVTVPDDCIWVMGDNRENSFDSRGFGPVPLSNVTGHAIARYFPFDRIGSID